MAVLIRDRPLEARASGAFVGRCECCRKTGRALTEVTIGSGEPAAFEVCEDCQP